MDSELVWFLLIVGSMHLQQDLPPSANISNYLKQLCFFFLMLQLFLKFLIPFTVYNKSNSSNYLEIPSTANYVICIFLAASNQDYLIN